MQCERKRCDVYFILRVAGTCCRPNLDFEFTRCSRSRRRGGVLLVLPLLWAWLTMRYIPNDYVGIVEKLWSPSGSVAEGRIIALGGEAGYQAALLRGGVHFGLWRWQYAVHKVRLVTISEGKIGYVYARDGQPLPSSQTLGRVVACNNFQDAAAFLSGATAGQRGRQRGVLREGVYAINLAVFTVITEIEGPRARRPCRTAKSWKRSTSGAMRCWRSTASVRSSIGRKMHAADPLEIDGHMRSRQHRHRHGARRSVAAAGRDHRPGRRHRRRRSALPQQLPGPRGVPRGRRPPRPAVCAAHRRHVLHQPLVRLGRADSQDGRADRLRRRGRELLRPRGPGRHRHRLPPRRARRRRRARRAPAAAWARASTRSTRSPAASCWCRRRTSCCTGSPARANRTATTRA